MTVGSWRRNYPAWSSIGADGEDPVTTRGVGCVSYVVNNFPTSIRFE